MLTIYLVTAILIILIINIYFVFIYILPISLYLLIINCFVLIVFKKWLGPLGVFYFSISIFLSSILNNLCLLNYNISSGSFIFIDFGRWFFVLDLINSNVVFCFDNLALILGTMVLLLAIIAQIFGIEYMARELFITRLIYLLNLFSTSVIFLFFVYDFFLILIAWELIGLFSFLLVNFYSLTIYTLKSSLKTFLFSRLSDLFIFLSFNICILVFNSSDLTIIFLQTPFFMYHNVYVWHFSLNILTLLTCSLSLASVIKAAQFGFHVWLPDAMNAPTPASSLIHSSTLVIMGIYLIIRFNLIFEFTPIINIFLILLGSLTISIGAIIAVFQTDIKKLVAYSTISQMGYLVAGCGFCAYNETLVYLIMHAINKAFLFIIVGYTVHFFNSNTDLRQMGHLSVFSYDITIYFLLVSLNLIGLPFSSGFYSKEFLLFQLFDNSYISYIIKSLWVCSFIFTPIYMFILIYYVNFNIKKNIFKNYFSTTSVESVSDQTYFHTIWNLYNIFNITSKSTCFILFIFFIICNYFGDIIFLNLIEFTSQNLTILKFNYFKIAFNYTYAIDIYNTNFIINLFFSILILTFISLKFLLLNFYKNSGSLFIITVWLDILLCILFSILLILL